MSEAAGRRVYDLKLGGRYTLVGLSMIDSPPLPIYSDLLEGFAEVLKRRVKAHHQNVVAIVGGTGSGKSAAGYRLCRLVDRFFTLEGNYIYTTYDLAVKLIQDPNDVSPVNFMDEGSAILNSSKHASKDSIDITILFDTMRSRGMTTIICIPKLRSLNNRIREDHLDFLFVCGEKAPIPGFAKRGFIKLFRRTQPSTFKSGIFWEPIAWGIYKPMTASMEAEYETYKHRSQGSLLEDFYRRIMSEEGKA